MKNLIYTGVAQLMKAALLLVTTAASARLLSPHAFGIIAASAPVITLASLIQDFGLSQAIAGGKTLSRKELSILLSISLMAGSILTLVTLLLSKFVAHIYGIEEVETALMILSCTILFSSGAAVPQALLQREGRFGVIALCEIMAASLGTGTTVGIAYFSSAWWALPAGSAIQAASLLIPLLLITRLRPHLGSVNGNALATINLGSRLLFFNIANYVSRNSDNVIAAYMFGPVSVGIYDRAYKIMALPLNQINAPVARFTLPKLASAIDDSQYAGIYLRSTLGLSALTQPWLILAIMQPTGLSAFVLGPGWDQAASVLRWLAVGALHQPLTSTLGWLFISQRRGDAFAAVGFFGAATTLAAFLVGAHWGIVGMAVSYAITEYGLRLPLAFWAATRRGPVSAQVALRHVYPIALATLGSMLAAAILTPNLANAVARASLCSAIIATTYYPILLTHPLARSFCIEIASMLSVTGSSRFGQWAAGSLRKSARK